MRLRLWMLWAALLVGYIITFIIKGDYLMAWMMFLGASLGGNLALDGVSR